MKLEYAYKEIYKMQDIGPEPNNVTYISSMLNILN